MQKNGVCTSHNNSLTIYKGNSSGHNSYFSFKKILTS